MFRRKNEKKRRERWTKTEVERKQNEMEKPNKEAKQEKKNKDKASHFLRP